MPLDKTVVFLFGTGISKLLEANHAHNICKFNYHDHSSHGHEGLNRIPFISLYHLIEKEAFTGRPEIDEHFAW